MAEIHKIIYRGKAKGVKKLRKVPVKVFCSRCKRPRMTLANDRCVCFFCGKTNKVTA